MRNCWLLVALAGLFWIVSNPASGPKRASRCGSGQSSSEIYQDVYNGWKWWHVYCYRCHGQDALGTTLAPNLMDPNVKFTLPEFLR